MAALSGHSAISVAEVFLVRVLMVALVRVYLVRVYLVGALLVVGGAKVTSSLVVLVQGTTASTAKGANCSVGVQRSAFANRFCRRGVRAYRNT